MQSGIYQGFVRHRRFAPRYHDFTYQVFMVYLDLAEVDKVMGLTPLWSQKSWALARFKREDFFGDASESLDHAVRNKVLQESGVYPEGPIRLLANLRYFGYIMNPISCYYCFAADGETLEFIVAEVNNTPWDERHAYVLDCRDQPEKQNISFNKDFHVSPFMPMDMRYHWRSRVPNKNLLVHLENHKDQRKAFDASLVLKRKEITSASLNRALLAYPFMTLKVVGAIYWQALKLWLKGVSYVPHPERSKKAIAKGTPLARAADVTAKPNI